MIHEGPQRADLFAPATGSGAPNRRSNEPLAKAEEALLELVAGGRMVGMDEILEELRPIHKEAELRAAVWTLTAEGRVEFVGRKVAAVRPNDKLTD